MHIWKAARSGSGLCRAIFKMLLDVFHVVFFLRYFYQFIKNGILILYLNKSVYNGHRVHKIIKSQLRFDKMEECFKMEDTIRQIIEVENKEYDEFMEYQKERISELQDMLARKNRGEEIDISGILSSLKRSGILDDNNNISRRYAG